MHENMRHGIKHCTRCNREGHTISQCYARTKIVDENDNESDDESDDENNNYYKNSKNRKYGYNKGNNYYYKKYKIRL